MKFPKLFSTCHIGKLELRNRIIMLPITTNFAKDGHVTERMKNYYATIARGGAGMVMVEDAMIDSLLGRHTVNDLHIDDDSYVPNLNQLANCIKAQGARAAIQINHGGQRAGKIINGYLDFTKGKIPVAPSRGAYFETGFVVPRELTIDEIEDLIEKYVTAAVRVKEAGFDALMIHCTHAYLINQFLSPTFNKRQDEYGGDLEGRMRFVLKIIAEIRNRLGPTYPLLCRISGEEPFEEGLNLDDMKQIARKLEEASIQAFILSRGSARFPATSSKFVSSIAPMRIPRGPAVYLSEGIKQAVQVPVTAVNRINDPILAERILGEGKADLIGMGRALIADPELPNKAKEDRPEEIRTCIACMWCSQKIGIENSHIVCALNAQVGRETPLDLGMVETPKKVLIVGGGPAGMEAARVAAIRGHEVHLYEGDAQLGGQLLLASKPPGKEEINEFTRFLKGEISRLGVNIKTNTPVTSDEIKELSPDIIVMATGSIPKRPPIPGIGRNKVVTATEVLKGEKEVSGKVVILGGGQVGAEVAEYLATKGMDVTIVEMTDQIAADSPVGMRPLLLLSLQENGVKIINRAEAKKIDKSGVIVDKSGSEMAIPADSVILALGGEPDRSLKNITFRCPILWVGDCVKPRNILESVFEGFEAGANI